MPKKMRVSMPLDIFWYPSLLRSIEKPQNRFRQFPQRNGRTASIVSTRRSSVELLCDHAVLTDPQFGQAFAAIGHRPFASGWAPLQNVWPRLSRYGSPEVNAAASSHAGGGGARRR